MDGNTADNTTLRGFLQKIEQTYGKARRVWVMDRGIPPEELLAEIRAQHRALPHPVASARGKLKQYEKALLELPWKQVQDSVQVKLLKQEEEVFVLAKSEGRRA